MYCSAAYSETRGPILNRVRAGAAGTHVTMPALTLERIGLACARHRAKHRASGTKTNASNRTWKQLRLPTLCVRDEWHATIYASTVLQLFQNPVTPEAANV